MDPRPYDPARDRSGLWALKQAFERELGGGSDEAKHAVYEAKLTGSYRDRYLEWVDRCVDESPSCVAVLPGDDDLVGYVFVLPESLALIWDAAVLNEIYVEPAYRGTGLADALLSRALAVARQQSLPIDRIVLDVAPSNRRAGAFYERHGFEPWGDLVARPL